MNWCSPPICLMSGLENVRVYFSGTYRQHAYPPDFANDLAETNLDWPGPPDDRRLAAAGQEQPGIDVQTWTEQAERFAAFFGGAMRVAAARNDWDLMLGYLPVIDEAGHALLLAGPRQAGWSAARRDELAGARRRVCAGGRPRAAPPAGRARPRAHHGGGGQRSRHGAGAYRHRPQRAAAPARLAASPGAPAVNCGLRHRRRRGGPPLPLRR